MTRLLSVLGLGCALFVLSCEPGGPESVSVSLDLAQTSCQVGVCQLEYHWQATRSLVTDWESRPCLQTISFDWGEDEGAIGPPHVDLALASTEQAQLVDEWPASGTATGQFNIELTPTVTASEEPYYLKVDVEYCQPRAGEHRQWFVIHDAGTEFATIELVAGPDSGGDDDDSSDL